MLTIQIKPSKALTLFFCFVHIGAVLILLMMRLPVGIKFLSLLLCLWNLWYCLGRYILCVLPNAITQAWRTGSGEWLLLQRNGSLRQAQLLGNSFTSPYLVILNFRIVASKKHVSLLLAFDCYESEVFRRMRVALLN